MRVVAFEGEVLEDKILKACAGALPGTMRPLLGAIRKRVQNLSAIGIRPVLGRISAWISMRSTGERLLFG